jgi:hypothetical protein
MSESSGEHRTPSFELLLDVASAGADIQRLVYLDRAWTAAGGRQDLTGVGRQRLSFLGESVDAELANLERHVMTLGDLFAGYGDWVDARVEHELEGDVFTAAQRVGVRRFLRSDGHGHAARGLRAVTYLADNASRERSELRDKIRSLRAGQTSDTDMSHDMFCNLAAGGIVADLAVCPETLGVGCAAALAVYLVADSEGC